MIRSTVRGMVQRRQMSSLVKFKTNNTARVVTLNRPEKLNAINHEICHSILPVMQEYAKSDVANVIVFDSACAPRAFCAGGDIVLMAKAMRRDMLEKVDDFFQGEYTMNWMLATYPKPVVALMDGITMGGGVGLTIHVPFRVATENTKWAMPELDIGLHPDVGVSFALPRIMTLGGQEGQLGYYLCLTGEVLQGADVYMAGLASHYVESTQHGALKERLGTVPITRKADETFANTNAVIEEFSSPLPDGYQFKYNKEELDVIERFFHYDVSYKELRKNLEAFASSNANSEVARNFAKATLEKLSTKSTVSAEITREQFRRNSQRDIQSAMKQDLITSTNLLRNNELAEFENAVIHKLVEKAKTPYEWKNTSPSVADISKLLAADPANPIDLLETFGVTFKNYRYHNKFTLPTEAAVQAYITGTDQSGRSMAVTRAETVKYFTEFNPVSRGKVGTEYVVNLIIDRKCRMDNDSFLHWNY
ncbi:AGR024Cp [Eremothecium gossypii ATCC 10895]|uniref:3-hydroxyisobutyryl-CoA hydrolase n=1 Tax=Eremothecium gossypii (strain ATCC 10895 / CBS 109.51 / FGSC 9923 / NRRL Y-1056) TaxID=284811 RepID=Q750D1_EREGS|nr:AGR024Cp [Eremothecium gossypii ATCC 10895]AAS54513.1 AGR024Cp [Eremothecium gossypii ATCC 10895]AEY98845.1 FAGR024Cp [Eremothecium gossypii FDAG1]